MSEFFFECPGCKQEIKGDTEWIGQSAECPYCLAQIVIKAPKEAPKGALKKVVEPAEEPKTTTVVFKCPCCSANLIVSPEVKPIAETKCELILCSCCKKGMSATAASCPHCGAVNGAAPVYKSRFIYIILGLFLGGFGIHDIYANYDHGVAHFFIALVGTVCACMGETGAVIFGGLLLGVNSIWVISEICTVEKDGNGVPFK